MVQSDVQFLRKIIRDVAGGEAKRSSVLKIFSDLLFKMKRSKGKKDAVPSSNAHFIPW